MRIGYFGGSFDPPHNGHLAVVRAARDRFALDRVLLAPTGRQPFKPAGPRAGFTDRSRMTGLLCAGWARLEVSAAEAPSPDGTPNYTIDTLRRLRRELTPAARTPSLFVITGIDAFLGLPQWREPEQLLELAQWIVVSRPGSDFAAGEALALRPPGRARVHFLEGIAEPASATEVRRRLAAGLDCTGLVPGPVLRYITDHRLYRVSDSPGDR